MTMRPDNSLKGLLAVFFVGAVLPSPVLSCAAQESAGKTKRMYTNDDIPSIGAKPGGAADEKTSSADVADPHGPVGRVAPFVTTPMDLVAKMLEIAKVTSDDTVYDLGSGDGRIVFYAAEKFGANSVGIELDRDLAKESREEARRRKIDDKVKIIQGDLFETDVSPATVVTVYLLQAANRKLSPILEKDLRPGTRVIAHDIRIPDWKPVEELAINSGEVQHFIYLYRVPESFKK